MGGNIHKILSKKVLEELLQKYRKIYKWERCEKSFEIKYKSQEKPTKIVKGRKLNVAWENTKNISTEENERMFRKTMWNPERMNNSPIAMILSRKTLERRRPRII